MTRKSQKVLEAHYVERFFGSRGETVALVEAEPPDFWIQRTDELRLGLEVTEYHPRAEQQLSATRAEIEGRWRRDLAPLFRQEQEKRPVLHNIVVKLGFSDSRLPRKREQQVLVEELIRLLEVLAIQPISSGRLQKIGFSPAVSLQIARPSCAEWTSFAREAWPVCAQHLKWLSVQSLPGIGLYPICCPDLDGAWCDPDEEEVGHILNGKTSKARKYDLQGAPLWLLIVCDLPADLQSCVFPLDGRDYREWLNVIAQTGFDLANSPFAEVWLLSASTGSSIRLCRPVAG